MLKKYFPKVEKHILYEGRDSINPLAFNYYNQDQKINKKIIAKHFRFSITDRCTFMGDNTDMFSGMAFKREWDKATSPMDRTREAMETVGELFQKHDVDYYYFYKTDTAPEVENFFQLGIAGQFLSEAKQDESKKYQHDSNLAVTIYFLQQNFIPLEKVEDYFSIDK